MLRRFLVLAGCVGIVALSACAPASDPIRAIYPEPVFDKYGGQIGGGGCPPGTGRGPNDVPGTTAYPSSQQDPCCPTGYSSQDGEICVPIPPRQQDGDDDGDRTPGTPNDPTRG